MVYQGSKDRIAKFIVPIIQNYINAYHIKTTMNLLLVEQTL